MNQSLLFYDGEIVTMTAAKPRAVLISRQQWLEMNLNSPDEP